MRGFVLGLLVAGGIVLVVTWWGSQGSGLPAVPPAAESSPAPIVTPTRAPPPVAAAAGCDEIDELFARMFVGLTQAVLIESGTEPEAFASAVAADRETLRRYLEVLDIPVDEAWLDEVMSPDLDRRLLRRCLEP